jgi:hypothetical protein
MTNSPSSSPPGRDYGAEQREQEAAAAAEEQRRRDAELEQQRREAENKRRLEEIERQTQFLNDRDAAAGTLRGSTGTGTPVNGAGGTGLRGSTGTGAAANATGDTGLRGSRADTGLRGLNSDTTQAPNLDPMVVDARETKDRIYALSAKKKLAKASVESEKKSKSRVSRDSGSRMLLIKVLIQTLPMCIAYENSARHRIRSTISRGTTGRR